MNLETHIVQPLWHAVTSTYEAKNYTHAILDAMHYLGDVLREKSGLDGDGVSLVGRALGGESPVLRVNALQTESERNIQKGFEQTMRGLYMAVRNPRSHEQIEDTQDTADAIIVFVNYLLEILDESQERFTITSFLSRVFDEHFVQDARYAELLAEEIPANKRLDTLIEIYREKLRGDGYNLAYMTAAIQALLDKDQLESYFDVVSDELRTTNYEPEVRMALQIFDPSLWQQLDEVARIRVENMVINSVKEGSTGERALLMGEPLLPGRAATSSTSLANQEEILAPS